MQTRLGLVLQVMCLFVWQVTTVTN